MSEKITRGSGNVFQDIGVSDPERTAIRALIMSRITEIIKERGLSQTEAGKILNLTQSKVSNLMNGKLSVFSLEHPTFCFDIAKAPEEVTGDVFMTLLAGCTYAPERKIRFSTGGYTRWRAIHASAVCASANI